MPDMVTETFPDPGAIPDPNYFMNCRVCGVKVSNWRQHKNWHEKLGDAIEQPGQGVGA